MNPIEDRIRAATHAAANSVRPDSVPLLRFPPELMNGAGPRGSRSHPGGWARRSRWLAPVAAAVAVAAVVAAVLAVRGSIHRSGAAADSPDVPPYFVALDAHGNPNLVPTFAVVRATMTGALLATIMPSVPGGMIAAVTAAADDRTFVLDEQKWVGPHGQAQQTRLFYLLRLDSSGRPASVTKLPMTAGRMVTGVALSPDGTRLAIAVQPQAAGQPDNELRVYTLATGAVRTWSQEGGGIGSSEDDAASISWTADGRRLAFDWGDNGSRQGTWLLDTTLGGSGLLASSRQVTSTYTPPAKATAGSLHNSFSATAPPDPKPPSVAELTCQGDQIVTPDGSAVICPALATFDDQVVKGHMSRNAETAFVEHSVATGKTIRVLGHWVIDNAGALTINVLWSNPSGTVLIAAIPDQGDGKVGVISGNTFTPLHIPADLNPSFADVW